MATSLNKSVDILFIGNNEVDQILVEEYLRPRGGIYFSANSYEQVEQLLREYSPEVTICENDLYGVDIRKICIDLLGKPCVFLSSRDRISERRKCMLQVRDCYLTRPYTEDQLIKAVSTARNEPFDSVAISH